MNLLLLARFAYWLYWLIGSLRLLGCWVALLLFMVAALLFIGRFAPVYWSLCSCLLVAALLFIGR